jgi:hypothetical protein
MLWRFIGSVTWHQHLHDFGVCPRPPGQAHLTCLTIR